MCKDMIQDLKKQQAQLVNVAEALTLVAKALNDTVSTLGNLGSKPS